MPATISLTDTRSLTAAINQIKTPKAFLFDKVFKSHSEYHASGTVDIEIVTGKDTIAEFVNEEEGARIVGKGSRKFETVKVPRTNEKKFFTATELANYQTIGHVYSNPQDIVRESNNFVLREIEELKDRIIRRREQMACVALSTGKIEVSQDNIEFKVDFKFVDNKHLLTNTGPDLWTDEASDPSAQIRVWKRGIMKSCGQNANIAVLGSEAAQAFLSNKIIKEQLHNNNYGIGRIDLNQNEDVATYLGRILNVDFWEYTQTYLDSDKVEKEMIDPKRCIIFPAKAKKVFRFHRAPIYRIGANKKLEIVKADIYVEAKVNESKTALEWSCEQKSLPTIHNPDVIRSIQVVA